MKINADLLVHADRIHTLNAENQTVEAMVIREGKILATGSWAELRAVYDPRQTLDRAGTTIVPGLIDPHCHLHRYAQELFEIDLRGTRSCEEMVARVQEFSRTHPEGWLVGRGWDQNLWPEAVYPTRELLDLHFPDRPVYLERIDIHAALVNEVLLQQAGITAATHIDGGEVRLEQGRPTGLLIDQARDPVLALMPTLTEAQWEQALLAAQEKLWAYGLCGLGDALLSRQEAERLLRLQAEGKFKLWVYGMLPADSYHLAHYLPGGPIREGRIHLGAFKLFADGTLGSRGAWLSEPYTDAPDNVGLALLPDAATRALARRVYAAGFQLCVHAIGDAANRQVLDLFAEVLGGPNDRRWRIEHCQMLPPELLPRFAQYDIFPSVQPTHATSDAPWVAERVGERLAWSYPARRLLQTCGHLALGTDFPVESPDPWATFRSAVFREAAGQAFLPEERLSPLEALRGMTLDSARAEFAESVRGSLEMGRYADFVVLAEDPLAVDVSGLENFRILETWLAGERVFFR